MFARSVHLPCACLIALAIAGPGLPTGAARAAAPRPTPTALAELQGVLAEKALPAYRNKAYADTVTLCQAALDRLAALGDSGAEATALRAHFVLLLAGAHDFLREPGQAVALYDEFLRVTSGLAAEGPNRVNARARLQALRGAVVLRVLPREAKVTLDGQPIDRTDDAKLTLLAGRHLVHVEELGFAAADRPIELEGGAELVVRIALEPLAAPSEGPSARAVGAWIAASVGVVGAVVGIVGATIAADKRSRIEDAADAHGVIDEATLTRKQALALQSDADTFSTMGLAGFIVAGVGAVATTTLLLLPDPAPATHAHANVTGLGFTPVRGGAVIEWGTRF